MNDRVTSSLLMRADAEAQWREDLARFATRMGVATPPLHVDMTKKTNAWASQKGITVTEDLLTAPEEVRLYLMAHELGHIAKRHSRSFSVAVNLFFGASALFGAALIVRASLATLNHCTALISATALSAGVLYMHNELDADRFAVKCIGVERCIEGSTEMGRLSGTLRTRERRLKLFALRRIAARQRRAGLGVDRGQVNEQLGHWYRMCRGRSGGLRPAWGRKQPGRKKSL